MKSLETHGESTPVDLVDMARLVRDLRWFIVGGAAAGLLIATATSLLIRPVYRAEVVTMPVSSSAGAGGLSRLTGQFGGLAALAGITIPAGEGRDEALAVILSRQFALDMIRDDGLMPLLFSERWDAASRTWKTGLVERMPTVDDAWRRWDRSVRRILEDRDRGLVTVRVEWHDPDIAAAWANQMIDRLNEVLRLRRLKELDGNIELLTDELNHTQVVEVRNAIGHVLESQVSERMMAKVRKEFALKVVDPALPPDLDRPVRPKPALYAVLGISAGILFGFGLGLVRTYVKSKRVHE